MQYLIFLNYYYMKNILFIIKLVMLFSFYNYLQKIKKKNCDCALNDNYYFIKKFTLIYIGYLIIIPLMVILLFLSNKKYYLMIENNFIKVLRITTIIMTLFYFYNIYRYIRILDSKNCNCSDSNMKTIMYFYSIIILLIIFL